MRKQANRWLVAVFLLFFIFSGIHMTAFGEEPAKDPLAQLEEEMGIGKRSRGSRNIWMGCGQREERSPLQI